MRTYEDWVIEAETKGLRISEVIVQNQMEDLEQSKQELFERMSQNLLVMRKSAETGLAGERRSLSGLVGGDAAKVEARRQRGESLVGRPMSGAIARALAVAEVNACMGKIVAAPTAGSCGVLPGVLLTLEEERHVPEQEMLYALFTAAGLGMIIAERANVSGAEGGCQAEIGSAAAMAAAAAVELAGGTARQTAEASALAMKSMLGLVCDPVGGLVEVPCVKRNATGAMIALTAAEMALSGVKSAIPVDEVIDTMGLVGKQMAYALRETAQGGLAVTPTGRRIQAGFR